MNPEPRSGDCWNGSDPDGVAHRRVLRLRRMIRTFALQRTPAVRCARLTVAGIGRVFTPSDSRTDPLRRLASTSRPTTAYTSIRSIRRGCSSPIRTSACFGARTAGGWLSATETVKPRWVNTTYWMEFDPAVRGRVWAVMSYTHDLPRPKMWRDRSPATFEGGVVISEDGGRTWRVSNQGMPETAATPILLDASSSERARVLYVAGFGCGVFRSIDGGRSWISKNDGLPHEPFAWRLARGPDRALYVVIARRTDDGSYGSAGDGGLYRSTDDAGHWNRVCLPTGLNGPNGLAIEPSRSIATVPGCVGSKGFRSRHVGRHLAFHRWRQVLAQHPVAGSIHLRYNGRSAESETSVRLWVLFFGLALRRSGRVGGASAGSTSSGATGSFLTRSIPPRSISRRTAEACGMVQRMVIRARWKTSSHPRSLTVDNHSRKVLPAPATLDLARGALPSWRVESVRFRLAS